MKQPFNLILSISFSKTDVAISAPYGGKDRGGVVFIYFGTKDGIESSFRQVNYFNGVLPYVIKKNSTECCIYFIELLFSLNAGNWGIRHFCWSEDVWIFSGG